MHMLHYQFDMDELDLAGPRDGEERYLGPRHPQVQVRQPSWEHRPFYGSYRHYAREGGISRASSNPHLNALESGLSRQYPSDVPRHFDVLQHAPSGPAFGHHYHGQNYPLAPVEEQQRFNVAPEFCRMPSPDFHHHHQRLTESDEIMMLKLQLNDRDRGLAMLEKQLRTNEDYLRDLPAKEELEKLQYQRESLEGEKEKTKRLKQMVEKSKDEIKTKDLRIETLERRNGEYRAKLELAKRELLKMGEKNAEGLSLGVITRERDRLLDQIRQLQKDLVGKERSAQHYRERSEREISSLKEKLENASRLSATLRVEAGLKEETICTLKAKNEQLLEENVTFRERIKAEAAAGLEARERYVLEKTLLRELRNGVDELRGLMEIIADVSQGGDVNVSLILGPSVSFSVEPKMEQLNRESISLDIEDSRDIAAKLSQLREKISDKYAEYLGDKLWCATQ